MDLTKLLARIETMNAEDKAKAIANYVSSSNRKKTIEDNRKDVRSKCFANCKKLTKEQQISFIYEFLSDNYNFFNNNWLRKNHNDLFVNK